MPLYSYQIGSSSSTTNVESLTEPLPAPRSTFNEFSQRVELASGAVRGGGWLVVTWTFDFLTSAQLAQLRTFCAGKSATIYIRTLNEDDPYPTYEYLTGQMVWPDGPLAKRNGRYQNVVIEFRGLTTFTP